jgi:hypothetical protein
MTVTFQWAVVGAYDRQRPILVVIQQATLVLDLYDDL